MQAALTLLLLAPGCKAVPASSDGGASAQDRGALVDAALTAPRPSPRRGKEIDSVEVRKQLTSLGVRDAERGRILALTADVAPGAGEETVYAIGVGGLIVLAGPEATTPGALLARADLSRTGFDSLSALVAVQAVPDQPWELLLEGFRGGSGGGALTMSVWKYHDGALAPIWQSWQPGQPRDLPDAGAARPDQSAIQFGSDPRGPWLLHLVNEGKTRYRWSSKGFRFEQESP